MNDGLPVPNTPDKQEFKLEVTISATAEIRDKDGNLISSSPVELTGFLSQEQYDEIARQQEES